MSVFSMMLAISSLIMLIGLILFVMFGQITVRKLRKNPETKNALGTEFASGWDILNTAQALAIPKIWAQKLKSSPLSGLYADVDLLYKNTSKFDRVLAFIVYWLLMTSVGILLVLMVLDLAGIFD